MTGLTYGEQHKMHILCESGKPNLVQMVTEHFLCRVSVVDALTNNLSILYILCTPTCPAAYRCLETVMQLLLDSGNISVILDKSRLRKEHCGVMI